MNIIKHNTKYDNSEIYKLNRGGVKIIVPYSLFLLYRDSLIQHHHDYKHNH